MLLGVVVAFCPEFFLELQWAIIATTWDQQGGANREDRLILHRGRTCCSVAFCSCERWPGWPERGSCYAYSRRPRTQRTQQHACKVTEEERDDQRRTLSLSRQQV